MLDDDTTEKSNPNTKFIGHEHQFANNKPKKAATNLQTDEINMITAKYLKFSDFLAYQLKMYQA